MSASTVVQTEMSAIAKPAQQIMTKAFNLVSAEWRFERTA